MIRRNNDGTSFVDDDHLDLDAFSVLGKMIPWFGINRVGLVSKVLDFVTEADYMTLRPCTYNSKHVGKNEDFYQ